MILILFAFNCFYYSVFAQSKKEQIQSLNYRIDSLSNIIIVERQEMDKLQNKIIHTRGAEGCDYQGINYPVEKFDIRDTSGAGDSFMAALVSDFLSSSNIIQSIKFANIAASKVVQVRGVGVI